MCILSIKDVAIIHFCTNWPIVALFFEREPKKKHWRRGGRMKIQGLVHHHHLHHYHHHHDITSTSPTLAFSSTFHDIDKTHFLKTGNQYQRQMLRICTKPATLGGLITNSKRLSTITAAALQPSQPLDLTEDNIRQVLADAREEFGHLFDASIGMTGQVDLAELDGPFVKISLKGRFWHERSVVLARLANYMKQRIPEILEVDIEDEKQLDDSPANF